MAAIWEKRGGSSKHEGTEASKVPKALTRLRKDLCKYSGRVLMMNSGRSPQNIQNTGQQPAHLSAHSSQIRMQLCSRCSGATLVIRAWPSWHGQSQTQVLQHSAITLPAVRFCMILRASIQGGRLAISCRVSVHNCFHNCWIEAGLEPKHQVRHGRPGRKMMHLQHAT